MEKNMTMAAVTRNQFRLKPFTWDQLEPFEMELLAIPKPDHQEQFHLEQLQIVLV